MKKNGLIFAFVFGLCILFNPIASASTVTDALNICGKIVIPSLFPFLIISSFIMGCNLPKNSGKIFSKIFKLPAYCFPVVFMGLLGGYPVGMNMISELYRQNKITEKTAHRLALFCINPGPAFVINGVGVSMLHNKNMGIILFVSVTLSSLLIGFFTRFFYEKDNIIFSENKVQISFSENLVTSVSKSTSSILSICSWIIFISAITGILSMLPIGVLGNILKNVAEVTTGCIMLKNNSPVFIAALIGFGGLTVHCQVLPNVNIIKMKVYFFFFGRILSSVLSFIICKIFLLIFPNTVNTFATASKILPGGVSSSIPGALGLIFLCALLILNFTLDREQKMC